MTWVPGSYCPHVETAKSRHEQHVASHGEIRVDQKYLPPRMLGNWSHHFLSIPFISLSRSVPQCFNPVGSLAPHRHYFLSGLELVIFKRRYESSCEVLPQFAGDLPQFFALEPCYTISSYPFILEILSDCLKSLIIEKGWRSQMSARNLNQMKYQFRGYLDVLLRFYLGPSVQKYIA